MQIAGPPSFSVGEAEKYFTFTCLPSTAGVPDMKTLNLFANTFYQVICLYGLGRESFVVFYEKLDGSTSRDEFKCDSESIAQNGVFRNIKLTVKQEDERYEVLVRLDFICAYGSELFTQMVAFVDIIGKGGEVKLAKYLHRLTPIRFDAIVNTKPKEFLLSFPPTCDFSGLALQQYLINLSLALSQPRDSLALAVYYGEQPTMVIHSTTPNFIPGQLPIVLRIDYVSQQATLCLATAQQHQELLAREFILLGHMIEEEIVAKYYDTFTISSYAPDNFAILLSKLANLNLKDEFLAYCATLTVDIQQAEFDSAIAQLFTKDLTTVGQAYEALVATKNYNKELYHNHGHYIFARYLRYSNK